MFENMNMKRIVLYLVAIMCIAFGIGFAKLMSSSGGVVGLFSGNFNGGRYEVNQEQSSPSNGLKEIRIEATSADIIIIPEDRSDIKAHLTGRVSSREIEPKLEMNLESDRLSITAKHKNMVGLSLNVTSNLQLKIYVPKGYENNLLATTVSGDVSIRDFKLKEFNCHVTSGDLSMDNLIAEKISFNGTSGKLEGNNITSQSTSFRIVSGNARLQNFKGQLDGSTTSGKIRVSYAEFNNNINLSSTSGDVVLDLPDNAEFYLDSRTTSGDINCKFPITIAEKKKEKVLSGTVRSDKNKINIHVTSGDIDIE